MHRVPTAADTPTANAIHWRWQSRILYHSPTGNLPPTGSLSLTVGFIANL